MDCGDAPLTWLDNTVALKQLDLAHKVYSSLEVSVYAFVTLMVALSRLFLLARQTIRTMGARLEL